MLISMYKNYCFVLGFFCTLSISIASYADDLTIHQKAIVEAMQLNEKEYIRQWPNSCAQVMSMDSVPSTKFFISTNTLATTEVCKNGFFDGRMNEGVYFNFGFGDYKTRGKSVPAGNLAFPTYSFYFSVPKRVTNGINFSNEFYQVFSKTDRLDSVADLYTDIDYDVPVNYHFPSFEHSYTLESSYGGTKTISNVKEKNYFIRLSCANKISTHIDNELTAKVYEMLAATEQAQNMEKYLRKNCRGETAVPNVDLYGVVAEFVTSLPTPAVDTKICAIRENKVFIFNICDEMWKKTTAYGAFAQEYFDNEKKKEAEWDRRAQSVSLNFDQKVAQIESDLNAKAVVLVEQQKAAEAKKITDLNIYLSDLWKKYRAEAPTKSTNNIPNTAPKAASKAMAKNGAKVQVKKTKDVTNNSFNPSEVTSSAVLILGSENSVMSFDNETLGIKDHANLLSYENKQLIPYFAKEVAELKKRDIKSLYIVQLSKADEFNGIKNISFNRVKINIGQNKTKNPNYDAALKNYNWAVDDYNKTIKDTSMPASTGNATADALARSLISVAHNNDVEKSKNRVEEYKNYLNSVPQYITENVFKEFPTSDSDMIYAMKGELVIYACDLAIDKCAQKSKSNYVENGISLPTYLIQGEDRLKSNPNIGKDYENKFNALRDSLDKEFSYGFSIEKIADYMRGTNTEIDLNSLPGFAQFSLDDFQTRFDAQIRPYVEIDLVNSGTLVKQIENLDNKLISDYMSLIYFAKETLKKDSDKKKKEIEKSNLKGL